MKLQIDASSGTGYVIKWLEYTSNVMNTARALQCLVLVGIVNYAHDLHGHFINTGIMRHWGTHCTVLVKQPWPHFYQTRSAWSMDQGSTKKRSAVHNDTKFGNCRGEIVDRRVIFIWSLIHGSSWSGLIKVGPDEQMMINRINPLTVTYISINKTKPAT